MRYSEFRENRISGVPTLAGGATAKFKKAKDNIQELEEDLECTDDDPCGYCKKCKTRGTLKVTEDEEDTLHPPSISKGDEVKVGKFKNSKATVKGFKKDDHNQPVLKTNKGDKKLFNLRLSKIQPK